jgi:hypothetical protein
MVLIAMLLPALNKARQQANITACLSNLRQMGIGVQYYLQDFKGVMPLQYASYINPPSATLYSDNLGDLIGNGIYAGAFGDPYTVLGYLDAYYLHQPGLFLCPAVDPDTFDGGSHPLNPSYPYDYFRSDYAIAGYGCSPAWSLPANGGPQPVGTQGGACFSYAYASPVGGTTFYDNWIKITMIQDPSHRLMIADKGGQLFGSATLNDGGENELVDIRRGYAGYQYSPGGVDNSGRHGGIAPTFGDPNNTPANLNTNAKVNFVCADGHAETDSYANVQMPTHMDSDTITPYIWLGPAQP